MLKGHQVNGFNINSYYVNMYKIGIAETVNKNVVAKNLKFHNVATSNWNFEKSRLLRADMQYDYITDIQAKFENNR